MPRYAVLCGPVCAMRSGPVRCSIRRASNSGRKHFTNQVKTHHSRHRHHHLPPALPRPRRWRRLRPRVPPPRRPRVHCAEVLGPRGTTPRAWIRIWYRINDIVFDKPIISCNSVWYLCTIHMMAKCKPMMSYLWYSILYTYGIGIYDIIVCVYDIIYMIYEVQWYDIIDHMIS